VKPVLRLGVVLLALTLTIYSCQNSPQQVEQPPETATGLNFTTSAVAIEELTDIDIPLAEGTGVVAAGVGLRGDPGAVQPDNISIDVPGDVKQVIIYWEGHMTSATGDPEITVDGNLVGGTLIGGPTLFFSDAWSTCYRADITYLDVVQSGANSIDIGGMDYDRLCPDACTNNGAGILVIYDDGSDVADIQIKDGLDLAFFAFAPPLDTTVPVDFSVAAATAERDASITTFASSVAPNRPNVVVVTAGSMVKRFVDPFQNLDGPDWDTVVLPFKVPAGVTTVTVQALSEEDGDSNLNGLPASLAWLAAGLTIEPTELEPMGCRVTGGQVDESGNCVACPDGSSGFNKFTCGGQAGANTALPPQPSGNWTHSNKHGPAGQFTFHAGTPSAPPGTEIDWIECSDPGWCVQARPAPAKQIDFGGVGTFKNMKNNVPDVISDHVVLHESLHWFEVNIDNGGEPGKAGKQDPPAENCPVDGFGKWGSQEFVNCDECPDFYRIMIYAGPTPASGVIYEASGWITGGNFQIHPLTGFDSN
jgi:hypothetical protein